LIIEKEWHGFLAWPFLGLPERDGREKGENSEDLLKV
jgi:hypothetical protein